MTDHPRLRFRIPDPVVPGGVLDEAVVSLGTNVYLAGKRLLVESTWPGPQIVRTEQGEFDLLVQPFASLYKKINGRFVCVDPGSWFLTTARIRPPERGFFLMATIAILFDFVDADGRPLPDTWRAS